MKELFSLTGKTCLVTGASSGIGRGIAIACAEMGAKVVLTARDEQRLQETLSQMEGEGHRYVIADVSTEEGVAHLLESLPQLDGVVCCAGIVDTTVVKFSTEEQMHSVFETNIYSVIRLCRGLVKSKRLNKGASVVFISSLSGVYVGYVGGSLYGASKGALQAYMKALALEVAPRKIRVNCINPGMVHTRLLEGSNIDEQMLAEDMKHYPLKRYGTPQDVAGAAVYLLCDASEWMTGANIKIDGGYTLN